MIIYDLLRQNGISPSPKTFDCLYLTLNKLYPNRTFHNTGLIYEYSIPNSEMTNFMLVFMKYYDLYSFV